MENGRRPRRRFLVAPIPARRFPGCGWLPAVPVGSLETPPTGSPATAAHRLRSAVPTGCPRVAPTPRARPLGAAVSAAWSLIEFSPLAELGGDEPVCGHGDRRDLGGTQHRVVERQAGHRGHL